jgi:hypothetical protein
MLHVLVLFSIDWMARRSPNANLATISHRNAIKKKSVSAAKASGKQGLAAVPWQQRLSSATPARR